MTDATTAATTATAAPDAPDAHADCVRWPINRLSYKELAPAELAVVAKLFAGRDDSPLLVQWVLEHSASGGFHARLAVVSAFRVWLLRRRTQPFGAPLVRCRELQLMHVRCVRVLRSATTTSLQVLTADAQMLHVDPGAHTESFVRLFQRLLRALRLVFPDKQFPVVSLPPQCPWEEFFAAEEDSALLDQQHQNHHQQRAALFDAMTTAYRAFCDDLGVSYRASVTTRLVECAGASVDFQYCLAFPPGVDGYQQQQQPSSLWRHLGSVASGSSSASAAASAAIQLREVQALARTLEHCHCFDGIFVYDLAMNEVGMSALFQALLSPFSAINAFSLTNINLTARSLRTLQHVVLQSTVKRVQQQPLQLRRLDFSFNRFSPAMASELATIFELLPTALEVLQLEQCALSAASSCRVLRSVKTNAAFSSTLRELNVSGNQLDAEGSRVLATWISGAFALHHLDVSQTALCVNTFVQALRQNSLLHESALRVLDLSYNRMRTQASQDLGWILGKTQSLSTLFLRGMQRRVVPSLQAIARSASKRAGPLHGFRASKGLKKLYLTSILAPMFRNTGRALPCLVDLSENDLSGRKAALLAQLLDDAPFTGRASLRLDHAQLHDKSSVLLLHALRSCRTLASLSLEGNGYVKRRTRSSLQRFHDGASSAPPGPPSSLEVAAANALALLLGGKSSTGDQTQQLAKHPSLSDVRSSFSKPVALKELCLKSESAMIFGAHVVTAAVDALALNQRLQVLDVSGNECGDVLASRLGSMLRTNRSLQVLFWDDNFTTVDGFFQFYDGLLANSTLVMVQMPIKDTRRILEEQKDPPREKLFSVLAKIFQVTERNQTTARDATLHCQAELNASQQQSPSAVPRRASATADNQNDLQLELLAEEEETSRKTHACNSPEDDSMASRDPHSENAIDEVDESSAVSALSPAPAAPAAPEEEEEEEDSAKHWSGALSGSTNSRYPSTMNSWSQASRDDLLRTSWTQLPSLNPSLSSSLT